MDSFDNYLSFNSAYSELENYHDTYYELGLGEAIKKRCEEEGVVLYKVTVITDNDNNILGLWGYFRDNTEEILELNKMTTNAMTDELTKLSNRRGLDSELLYYEESYKNNNIDFVLYFLDIDKFKLFNDTYGHDLGDIVLTSVAKGLIKAFNSSAIIARHGGDEFIVVKQFNYIEEIDQYRNIIDKVFDSISIEDHPEIKVRCSIGNAIYSEVMSLDNLIKLADYRMYEVKRERNIKNINS
jgi:diguanylate cyclase (GGDEF)-like protein